MGVPITDFQHIRGYLLTSIVTTTGSGLLIFSNRLIIGDFKSPFINTGYPSYSLSGFAGFTLDVFFRSDVTTLGFDSSVFVLLILGISRNEGSCLSVLSATLAIVGLHLKARIRVEARKATFHNFPQARIPPCFHLTIFSEAPVSF